MPPTTRAEFEYTATQPNSGILPLSTAGRGEIVGRDTKEEAEVTGEPLREPMGEPELEGTSQLRTIYNRQNP